MEEGKVENTETPAAHLDQQEGKLQGSSCPDQVILTQESCKLTVGVCMVVLLLANAFLFTLPENPESQAGKIGLMLVQCIAAGADGIAVVILLFLFCYVMDSPGGHSLIGNKWHLDFDRRVIVQANHNGTKIVRFDEIREIDVWNSFLVVNTHIIELKTGGGTLMFIGPIVFPDGLKVVDGKINFGFFSNPFPGLPRDEPNEW